MGVASIEAAISSIHYKSKNKIMPGTRVMVLYSPDGQFTRDPARKYDGMDFVVKRKKIVMVGHTAKWYWELYGAESEYGISYGFCEEDLVRI